MHRSLSEISLRCTHRLHSIPRLYNPQTYLRNYSTKNPLPASFLRGGTSKGIFIKRSDLPTDTSQWNRIFLGIMGSPDPEHGRQLNGMGGGISSLSKICVVGEPSDEQRKDGIEAEYTFVQVGIRDSSIDYSGNCGNLSSMIGVFAVDSGICIGQSALKGARTVRAFNTNTQKIVETTFPISVDGVPVLDIPETSIAGVPGSASRILLDFVNPGGARTGRLLPTFSPCDVLHVTLKTSSQYTIPASLVDATNPTVFITLDDLHQFPGFDRVETAIRTISPVGYDSLEAIRSAASLAMGLVPVAQAQPKIAIISRPSLEDEGVDIVVHAISMGVLHKAVPITVGLCLGVAANMAGTLPFGIFRAGKSYLDSDSIRLKHPSGIVDVGTKFHGAHRSVKSVSVVRTGRRLMQGAVWW